MEIRKDKGLIYSQYVLDFLGLYIDRKDITCSVTSFNNCREQGYILTFYNDDSTKGLTLYIYAHRVSDEPTITWENKATWEKLYSEDAWINRTKSFGYTEIRELTKFAVDLIEESFKEGEKSE